LTGIPRQSWPTCASDMHAETANALPLRDVLRDKSGFCPRNLPFLFHEKVATGHFSHRNAATVFNFSEMITKSTRYASGTDSLSDVDRILVWGAVEGIDAKLRWGFGRGQRVFWAGLQTCDKLVGKSPINIKDEVVSIAHGDRIALRYFCVNA